jgi:hypothetical protein
MSSFIEWSMPPGADNYGPRADEALSLNPAVETEDGAGVMGAEGTCMASAVYDARPADLVGLGRVGHGAFGHDLRFPSRGGHPLGYAQVLSPRDRLEKPDPTGLERT